MGDDYESLPRSSSIGAQMTAGAFAGVMEHCVMFPLDSVKTRMQSLTSKGTLVSTLGDMIRTEGPLRSLRGMSAMVLGAGPAHALYFSSYEQMKEVLKRRWTSSGSQPFIHGTAGCFATILHDGIMTPADAVKQRMQMANSRFGSTWECLRETYLREGGRGLYRSYTTQLSMNIPFQSIHFIVYEMMQGVTNSDGHYNPKAHMFSGAVAGAAAATVTTPLDVCKTLLNTQDTEGSTNRIRGLLNAGRTVYRVGGVRGFGRGVSARVLSVMPSTALSWSAYEFCKYLIHQEFEEHGADTSSLIRPDERTHPSGIM